MMHILVRDDVRAVKMADDLNLAVPPLYEVIADGVQTTFRRMVMGYLIVTRDDATPRGFVLLVPSSDMQDCEIISHGGWQLHGAKTLFRMIFGEMKQPRVSARCLASNKKNIRALKMFGFVEEGRKRCPDGEHILFGMLREECRLLGKEPPHGIAEAA